LAPCLEFRSTDTRMQGTMHAARVAPHFDWRASLHLNPSSASKAPPCEPSRALRGETDERRALRRRRHGIDSMVGGLIQPVKDAQPMSLPLAQKSLAKLMGMCNLINGNRRDVAACQRVDWCCPSGSFRGAVAAAHSGWVRCTLLERE